MDNVLPTKLQSIRTEFILLAEKTGLILPLGEWTIQEACRQMNEWREAGHMTWTVAVNLSTLRFNHPRLIENLPEPKALFAGAQMPCL